MKKTIILSVSCSDIDYIQEERTILETWGRDITEGTQEDLELIFVRSRKNSKPEYIKEESILYVDSSDGVHDTYEKVLKAFKFIDEHFEYDYILKTNTSTYINISLLKKFIEELPENDKNIYGPRYIINGSSGGKMYFRGSFLLFPRTVIKDVIKSGKLGVKNVDDGEIFKRLHVYYEKKGEDIYGKMKQIIQGYYLDNKSVVPYKHEYAKDKISYRLKANYTIKRGEKTRFLIRDKMRSLHAYVASDKEDFIVPELNSENIVETLNGIITLKNGIKKSKNNKGRGFVVHNW